ncbi:MFS transporter [Saccharopolyspora gloriosae]|uniref:Putative MFS transporter n=1 Tax=Saccharopolyspora gloriosae TaxID=455344 RepID=A0A840NQT6_9PSEU|nr:MFS transporter [Saccharopolyspora gloriosae]MBB5070597.1 putative MFS transporter [Saccharopolyspora gloriosae]
MDSTADAAPAAPDERRVLVARLDRLTKTTRTHRTWMVLLGSLFIADLADLNVLSYAAPAIREQWDLSVAQVGHLTSLSFMGMFFGAIVGGRLADRFGRRRVVITATLFYSVASILCALAPNLALLGVFRLLSGLGVQAVTGVLIVYVAEMFPQHKRGRIQAFMLGIGLLGVPFIAGAARLLVPIGPDSWRWTFVVAAVGIVPAIAAWFKLPESARWLLVQDREAEADVIITKLEREAGLTPDQDVVLDAEPVRGRSRVPVTELLRGRTRKITIVASLVMVFDILGFYGFNAWVPTLLVEQGYSHETTLTITTIFAIGPFAGAFAGMLVADRWERKTVSLVLAAVSGAAIVVFAVSGELWLVVLGGFVATVLLQTNTAVIYSYLPEVFPTALRGAGAGLANGMGRLAGTVNGVLIAAVFAFAGFSGAFIAAALFILCEGLVIFFFGERTTGRRLADTVDHPEEQRA